MRAHGLFSKGIFQPWDLRNWFFLDPVMIMTLYLECVAFRTRKTFSESYANKCCLNFDMWCPICQNFFWNAKKGNYWLKTCFFFNLFNKVLNNALKVHFSAKVILWYFQKYVSMPHQMRRKVRQNMRFVPFVKNDFKSKVTNETIHNLGVADLKNLSDWIFESFL